VTDEDLVKLELFDVVLSQMRHKFDEKNRVWLDLLREAKEEITKKQKSMGSNNEKQKKTISESVLVTFLNQRLEQQHTQLFTNYFKHGLLVRNLREQKNDIRTPEDLTRLIDESLGIGEKDANAYRIRLNNEMNKFNGEV